MLATAREIAAHSPLAVWGTKVAMNYARDHPVDDALDQIATWQAGMFQPADMRGGLRRQGRAAGTGLPRPAARADRAGPYAGVTET